MVGVYVFLQAYWVTVGLTACFLVKLYLTSMNGAWPLLFWVSYTLLTIASKLLDTAETWWLGW